MFKLIKPVYAAPVELGKFYGFGGPQFSSLGQVIGNLLPIVFNVAVVIVVLFLLFAGFRYLTAGDNKEQTAKARAMITNSIIGFLLLIFLFLAIQFLFQFFLGNPRCFP